MFDGSSIRIFLVGFILSRICFLACPFSVYFIFIRAHLLSSKLLSNLKLTKKRFFSFCIVLLDFLGNFQFNGEILHPPLISFHEESFNLPLKYLTCHFLTIIYTAWLSEGKFFEKNEKQDPFYFSVVIYPLWYSMFLFL